MGRWLDDTEDKNITVQPLAVARRPSHRRATSSLPEHVGDLSVANELAEEELHCG
ncbi:hypothetical protein DIPPA_02862 [Diplonema papillatum]|nr:hypothetical protein DIPPA_02862 [Diplonema papillatum]